MRHLLDARQPLVGATHDVLLLAGKPAAKDTNKPALVYWNRVTKYKTIVANET